MSKLVQFLLGSIRISVTGTFPERFLNLCGIENLPFRDVQQKNEKTLSVIIPLYSWRKAKRLAARALCELSWEHGEGLPFFLYRFRSRYALIAGLLFAIFCASVLSRVILVVDVSGNERVADSVILTKLEELGFGVGSYGAFVDRRTLANDALLALPELSFLSINISGVRAEVVVRESTPPPELENRAQAADIVAAVDGVIVDVNAVMGKAQVEEGQAVMRGEVLISGLEQYERGDGSGVVLSSSEVRAEGEVWAYTTRILRACVPLEGRGRGKPVKEQVCYRLRLLKHFIKFSVGSSICDPECAKITRSYPLTLGGGTTLPLVWERSEYNEYEMMTTTLDRAQEEARLKDCLKRSLARSMEQSRGTAMTQKLSTQERSGVLIATLEASCVEQIGVRVAR